MINKVKAALTVNEKNIRKLFNMAANNDDKIFYINRLGRVDVLEHLKQNETNIPHLAEAKMSGLARNEKPGRLLAAFSKPDRAVHFYLNPKSDEQRDGVKTMLSSLSLKHENHENMLSHLKIVRALG